MNYRLYVDLIQQAEKEMLAKGKASLDERLYMLGGIYYATTWSAEYSKLHADDRRKAFERCLRKTYSPLDDPRPVIGAHAYSSLLKNQDVSGTEPVDMGHLLIGLAARLHPDARGQVMNITDLGGIPFVPSGLLSTKSTGLEIMTWVGDLGGATGRLALDRADAAAKAKPGTAPRPVLASKYFAGKDYGGPSNLYGDVYAYALAPGGTGKIERPAIGPPLASPASIGEAFESFFLGGTKGTKGALKANACKTFLTAIGGSFVAGGSLTNQATLESGMADKFEAFGNFYIYSYLKTFVVKPTPPPPPPPSGGGYLGKVRQIGQTIQGEAAAVLNAVGTVHGRHSAAVPFLRTAAEDVAKLFTTKLLANNLR